MAKQISELDVELQQKAQLALNALIRAANKVHAAEEKARAEAGRDLEKSDESDSVRS